MIQPLKKIIQSVTPPFVYQTTRGLLTSHDKEYESWAQAVKACRNTYTSKSLTAFRVERAKLNLKDLKAQDFVMNFEYLLIGLLRSKATRPIVLDFGGALGEQAYILRQLIDKPFDYIVVENKALVQQVVDDPFFEYCQFSETLPEHFDIFFSAGTFQCIENHNPIVDLAFSKTKEAVILTRNCFSPTTLYRVQKAHLQDNGPGEKLPQEFNPLEVINYPHQTIAQNSIDEKAKQHQWQCLLSKNSDSGIFPHHKVKLYGRDLFYIKISSTL